jgi:hypothetical protein
MLLNDNETYILTSSDGTKYVDRIEQVFKSGDYAWTLKWTEYQQDAQIFTGKELTNQLPNLIGKKFKIFPAKTEIFVSAHLSGRGDKAKIYWSNHRHVNPDGKSTIGDYYKDPVDALKVAAAYQRQQEAYYQKSANEYAANAKLLEDLIQNPPTIAEILAQKEGE